MLLLHLGDSEIGEGGRVAVLLLLLQHHFLVLVGLCLSDGIVHHQLVLLLHLVDFYMHTLTLDRLLELLT